MHEIVISRYMFFEALFVYVLDSTALYSDLQKHESSCLLSYCFSCISPEPFELQKSYLRLFASLSEELSDEKRIFQNGAFFPIAYFFLEKQRFCKYQLIL